MLKIGYKLMAEEHAPAELIRNAQRAEKAGFDFAAISDHYFPWLPEEGHAPFAWAVLGGLAQATERLGLMTAVTCPIMRYHRPSAQAAATLGVMSNGRFRLGGRATERACRGSRLAWGRGASRAAGRSPRHHPGIARGQDHLISRSAPPARPCQAVRPSDAQARRRCRGRWPRSGTPCGRKGRWPGGYRGQEGNHPVMAQGRRRVGLCRDCLVLRSR